MSNSEQSYQPFPMKEDIVIKLPYGTVISNGNNKLHDSSSSAIYESAKAFINKFINSIHQAINPRSIFVDGVKVEILEPGQQWKSGKLRCRLVFEFVPDEQENNTIGSESISPLDDLRKMNL